MTARQQIRGALIREREDAQAVLARSISEKQLSQHVVNLARMLGWRVARWPTWRPTGTDPGVPDLVMAKDGRVIFAELKATGGRVSDAQREWCDALHGNAPYVRHVYWFPANWLSGEVERVLRGEG
jgi:hypothetical protein